jgi:hypothetical protein
MTTEQKLSLVHVALNHAIYNISADDKGQLHRWHPSLTGLTETEAIAFLKQAANHVITNGASNVYGAEGIFLPAGEPEPAA